MAALEDVLHPFKSLYRKSPSGFKHTVGRVYSALPERLKYGALYAKTRADLQKSQGFSVSELEALQLASLKHLIAHCWHSVPFYQQYWLDHGVVQHPIETLSDIEQYPLIDKQTVRENGDAMIASGYESRCLAFNTGGSTGEPLTFYWEKYRTRTLERAFIERQWNWAGYKLDDKTAIVKGQTISGGKHYDPTQNALYISGFDLDNDAIARAIDAMREFQPLSLQAYPSTATLIARYMLANKVSPIASIRVVLCGSENLYFQQRQLIELAFDCRAYSWYGHGESVCLAGGCEQSDQYHVYSEYGLMELVDDTNSVLEWRTGAKGEMVGTGFNNYAMPLVRYKTADIAVVGEQGCACGRAYPVLSRIEGRKQEYVVGRNGQLVALTALIFGQHHEAFEHIDKMQIEQRGRGEFLVRIQSLGEWPEHASAELEKSLIAVLPNPTTWKVDVQLVDTIALTERGKHRFVIQHLDVPQ